MIEATGGVSLHANVWTDGDERPFLLVHGLASNARLWDGVAAVLTELGHPVAAIDQRGHGLSDKPDDGYDFVTVTDDLVRVIEALGWDRPVVAGQSWGGNVVLELARRHPELMAGVIGVDGGTIELAQRLPDWSLAETLLAPPRLAGTPLADLEQRLREMRPDWPESGIQGALACFELRDDGTVAPWLTFERHMTIVRQLWEHHPSSFYAEVEVPVLLVPANERAADPDRLADKRAGIEAAAAALPVSKVVWFDGDHDLHAQHPEAVASLFHRCAAEGFFR
jgi:pimeloyl-ACP methyl ester carboxylesterase